MDDKFHAQVRRGLTWHSSVATGAELVTWLQGRKDATTTGFGQMAALDHSAAIVVCRQLLGLKLLESVGDGGKPVGRQGGQSFATACV